MDNFIKMNLFLPCKIKRSKNGIDIGTYMYRDGDSKYMFYTDDPFSDGGKGGDNQEWGTFFENPTKKNTGDKLFLILDYSSRAYSDLLYTLNVFLLRNSKDLYRMVLSKDIVNNILEYQDFEGTEIPIQAAYYNAGGGVYSQDQQDLMMRIDSNEAVFYTTSTEFSVNKNIFFKALEKFNYKMDSL